MYRCYVTGKMSKPGEKVNKLVIKTRPRTYWGSFQNEETGNVETVEIGHGSEIVREVNVTDEGMRMWNDKMVQK